ncbi:DUF2184 domain-containing protein [uncultured Paraglaciecola sp.]|uniref:DUF2184 domain-containing protein n=1 Tax=uncultured Paraglaciecola sp. TaxID=1765024 RepID=UPI002623C84E|nr:major capsid family protein [uncultured Paraglaciecola sp.]
MKINFTADAMQAAMTFVEKQKTHIESGVNATVYPEIQYPSLIPVDTSAHPFAKSVTYYSSDKFGKANWINGNSDDIPLAGTELAQHETQVYMAGIGYGYGFEEINQAQLMGVNLSNDDAMAARRAYEEMVDRVALYGDASKGFQGLVSNTAVTATNVTTGDWNNAATTEDQILDDVNELILGVATDTAYTSMANTLLLSNAKLSKLATKRIDGTGTSLMEYLRKNNTYTQMTGQQLTIKGVRGLETAGTGDESRMIAYSRDPRVMKMHIPMPHRFLPVYQDGPLNFVIPGVFRLGGLDIRYPREVRYGDGI